MQPDLLTFVCLWVCVVGGGGDVCGSGGGMRGEACGSGGLFGGRPW